MTRQTLLLKAVSVPAATKALSSQRVGGESFRCSRTLTSVEGGREGKAIQHKRSLARDREPSLSLDGGSWLGNRREDEDTRLEKVSLERPVRPTSAGSELRKERGSSLRP